MWLICTLAGPSQVDCAALFEHLGLEVMEVQESKSSAQHSQNSASQNSHKLLCSFQDERKNNNALVSSCFFISTDFYTIFRLSV